jgi:outer membrane immunogenic protein
MATALAGLTAVPVLAADLPARTYTKAPAMVAAAYNWTGFYIGGHVGWGWEQNTWSEDASGTLGGPPGLQDADFAGNGVLGGGQIGFNYQVQNWVFGIQADASASGIKGSNSVCFPQFGVGFNTCSTKLESMETVTARVGFAADRALFYVKGGAAWAKHSYDNPATGLPTAVSSDVRNGWTAGAGIEYAFAGPWSVLAEYDYLDFGTRDLAFSTANVFNFSENVRDTVHILKVGVNYRFGGPLVAKY